jgi:hypothetical protein
MADYRSPWRSQSGSVEALSHSEILPLLLIVLVIDLPISSVDR